MSIETTEQILSDDFKTNQATVAGFVKNDASGNFLFGESGSGWNLLETKNVASDVASITFSGLDGDTDRAYRLVYRLTMKPGEASNEISLRPNGISTNMFSMIHRASSSGSFNVATRSELSLVQHGGVIAVPFPYFGIADFWAERFGTTGHRMFMAYQSTFNVQTGNVALRNTMGRWLETATNVTSLVVQSTLGTNVPAGSSWSLYVVKQTP